MTPRQSEILAAIVELYARTAEPVGSLGLAEQFGCSPATIRAEMVELERLGYIRQPHTSAGRLPTDKGYRSYVNTLQPGTQTRREQAIGRQIKDAGEAQQAVKNAVRSLSVATDNFGIATWLDRLHHYGLASLMMQPEFFGGREAFELARLIDDLPELLATLHPDAGRVSVFIGAESPVGKAAGASSIIARVDTPYGHEYIGVIGPTRQDYGRVVGLVDYVSRQLEEALHG